VLYENLIEVLLTVVPELKKKYEDEIDYIENLPHLVFEIVFVPYFKETMENAEKQTQEIAIGLLEEMIACDDEKVQEVAVVSVLEPLLAERDFLMKARDRLGLKTQAILRILEKDFGWSSHV
jgi:hypothetical protein